MTTIQTLKALHEAHLASIRETIAAVSEVRGAFGQLTYRQATSPKIRAANQKAADAEAAEAAAKLAFRTAKASAPANVRAEWTEYMATRAIERDGE